MKWLISIIVVASCNGCAFATLPTSKFTVHITDIESGVPVTTAVVQTTFEHKYDPWGGDNIVDRRKERVDVNGMVVFSGKDISGSFGAAIRAEGYYQDWAGLEKRKKNVVLNRWEPWNPTFEVKMRPKKRPVPMVFREGHKSAFKVPTYDQPVGYDLEKQDFVSPHGKGVHPDLFFEFKRYFKNSHNFDVSCEMTFPNKHDGIQECYFDESLRSSYRWPYLAPTNNYKPEVTWRSTRSNAEPVVHNFDEKRVNYIFRVRTRVDDEGNIVSACYGKIGGPFGLGWADSANWVYWFNPVPNEQSLEYSGENLLEK